MSPDVEHLTVRKGGAHVCNCEQGGVVPRIFQSKEKLGSKQQEFPFTSIEMFRAECLQRIRGVKKSL